MCGIVGYVGSGLAKEYLLNGLETLEYRGYDSAGIATLEGESVRTTKVVGRVDHLRAEENLNPHVGSIGIGHTRWATHGGVVVKNAHPHHDQDNTFFVVHNGIIENYEELRDFLKNNGFTFYSDTDSEVVPNLISYHYKKTKDVVAAFQAAIQALRGAYALSMITPHEPESLYVAKLSSPLAIGVSEGEFFVGSDSLPIASRTQDVIFLEDGEMAILSPEGYKIVDVETKKSIKRATELIVQDTGDGELHGFEDFMSKEIHEMPQTVRAAMLGRLKSETGTIKLGGLDEVRQQLDYVDRFVVLACGTSYYAGLVGEYLIEEIAGIPVEVHQASEFRYRSEPLSRSTAVIVVSQSGETADTIAALKKLEGSGILTLGIINAPGSTLARMTDAGVYCHAGPEKSVASTKAFVAQVTIFTLIALHLSKNFKEYTSLLHELDELPAKMEQTLKDTVTLQKLAKKYAHHRDFLFIGRRYGFPLALEGSLKLKEISYIHAEGYAGGEMKHGPLALIDSNFPTFAYAMDSSVSEKTLSNMQEIKARSGPILALIDSPESSAAHIADDTILIPKVHELLQPILAAVPTYLFAYYAAKELGRDIDRPRNLAKSVTVE